jgi:hypothetical protein
MRDAVPHGLPATLLTTHGMHAPTCTPVALPFGALQTVVYLERIGRLQTSFLDLQDF